VKTEHNVDLPSGRIRFALEALEEFERAPDCRVDMHSFGNIGPRFRTDDGSASQGAPTCFACLGGVAMMKLYGVDFQCVLSSGFPFRDARHTAFGEPIAQFDPLTHFEDSLESFRAGFLNWGIGIMGIEQSTELIFVEAPDFREDREGFYSHMRKMADALESENL